MNAAQRAKWERTRAKGFWRFVLLWWVLVWGGGLIIVTSLLDYVVGPGLRWEAMKSKVPIYLIAGFIAGVVVWWMGERRYQKSSGRRS